MSRRGPKARRSDDEGPISPRVDQPAEPSAEDALQFREAMRDVKPIRHAPRIRPTHGVRGSGALRRTHRPTVGAAVGRLDGAYGGPAEETAEEVVGGTETLGFRRPGVRDQVIRKLRRGLIPIEDELDLHGLNQAAARDLLEEFIAHQREAGHRCVRIVHGKGYRSGARGPILKMLVNGWLKRHLDVLAFCSARPIDGGTGAVYVLLRA